MNVVRTAGVMSALLLAACASDPVRSPAPVVDRTRPANAPSVKPAPVPATASAARPVATTAPDGGKYYTVRVGDTLYSIALENGLDYKEVAAWNHLADPNLIKIDQILLLSDPNDIATPDSAGVVVRPLRPDSAPAPVKIDTPAVVATPVATTAPVAAVVSYPKALKLSHGTDAATVARQAEGPVQTAALAGTAPIKPIDPKPVEKIDVKPDPKPADNKPASPALGEEDLNWSWPTVGKVITPFSDAAKGIDIGGKMGQPVLAASAGRVVYVGTMRGYGKLVIVKHNKTYLSAYAHNSQSLVKEGDNVKKGDKIAEMGNTDAEQVKLHFEIRRFGKPVDPTKYLTAG